MRKIIASLMLFILLLSPILVRAQSIDDITYDITSDQINLGALGIDATGENTSSLRKDGGREYVFDWYIMDFKSDIVVNRDGSLDITENIVADCGELSGKHGIFRVVPQYYYPKRFLRINSPVRLTSITDFDDKPYMYSEDVTNGNISWKIGDANKTVAGVNNYRIKYKVRDVMRGNNLDFDEFYWNLNGNFWDIETDHFSATITFPQEINQGTVRELNYYVGEFSANRSGDFLETSWTSPNVLEVKSLYKLNVGEGITISATFPKGIVSAHVINLRDYIFSFFSEGMVWFLIPLFVLWICVRLWSKYGKDPRLNRSIAPEFGSPDDMTPMEIGAFLGNGDMNTANISAEIVQLATKGIIKIEDIPKKGIFGSADTKLIIISSSSKTSKLNKEDTILLNKLFDSDISEGQELLISSLKNSFYKDLPDIKDAVKKKLLGLELFNQTGFNMRDIMMVVGIVSFFPAFFLFAFGFILPICLIISGVILVIFSLLMPQRSAKGVELLGRIRGFELYMKTAEKYRQKFNEKENIFERFLPYAMVFGIVGLWTDKMKQMYGEEYFKNYHPVWYVGAMNLNNGVFNVDSFASHLNAISSSMSSSMSSSPSSSGSGGGGFSGGGGGGGGGGGW